MRILFTLGRVTLVDMVLFEVDNGRHPEDDKADVVVVHHYHDDEDEEKKTDDPGDMFGGSGG